MPVSHSMALSTGTKLLTLISIVNSCNDLIFDEEDEDIELEIHEPLNIENGEDLYNRLVGTVYIH